MSGQKTTALGRFAAGAGRGLVAGVIGTAAMTISSTAESKLRHRPSSTVPSDVGGKLLGVRPRGPKEKERFSNLMHWQYGTSLGLLRAALGSLMRDPWAGAAFFGLVWSAELLMLPRLSSQASPPTEMEIKEVAVDGWHHLVYAAATSAAFTLLLRAKHKK
jgi:hypothetical protein